MASRRSSRLNKPGVLLDNSGDAAVMDVLAKLDPPKITSRMCFKAIWVLKALASRARTRIRANAETNNKIREKAKKTRKRTSESGKTLLKRRLQFVGLQMKQIQGDGNCQFRACSDQLFGSEDRHAMVRESAVSYMRANSSQFSCFLVNDERAFENYLKVLLTGYRGKPTWGDELTLRAICNTFGATIHVVTSETAGWYLKYEPEQRKTPKHLFLAYISPAHYNIFELVSNGNGSGFGPISKRHKNRP